jgi:hypothetical protein
MKIKLFTAPSEIDATIIKGALENIDIKASIGPGEGSLSPSGRSHGPNVPYDIFVDDAKINEARNVLKEGGWLSDVK